MNSHQIEKSTLELAWDKYCLTLDGYFQAVKELELRSGDNLKFKVKQQVTKNIILDVLEKTELLEDKVKNDLDTFENKFNRSTKCISKEQILETLKSRKILLSQNLVKLYDALSAQYRLMADQSNHKTKTDYLHLEFLTLLKTLEIIKKDFNIPFYEGLQEEYEVAICATVIEHNSLVTMKARIVYPHSNELAYMIAQSRTEKNYTKSMKLLADAFDLAAHSKNDIQQFNILCEQSGKSLAEYQKNILSNDVREVLKFVDIIYEPILQASEIALTRQMPPYLKGRITIVCEDIHHAAARLTQAAAMLGEAIEDVEWSLLLTKRALFYQDHADKLAEKLKVVNFNFRKLRLAIEFMIKGHELNQDEHEKVTLLVEKLESALLQAKQDYDKGFTKMLESFQYSPPQKKKVSKKQILDLSTQKKMIKANDDISIPMLDVSRERSASLNSYFFPTSFQKSEMEKNYYIKPTFFKPVSQLSRKRSVSIDSYFAPLAKK